MKKLLRPIVMGLMGLALFACDKQDDLRPLDKPSTAPIEEAVSDENPTVLINLSASLGNVSLKPLALSTGEDELRADINFNGTTSAPKLTTMSLLHTYFGERMEATAVKTYPIAPIHKLNARWGVLYGASNTAYGTNCTVSDNQEPASAPTDNLVVLRDGAEGVSISEAQVQMYCQLPANLENETKNFAFMCLDGVEGKTEATQTRQYFNGSFTDNGKTYVCDTDPNARIEGLTEDVRTQKDRHVPIMSKVVAYEKLANTTATTEKEKLAPRGSFVGLCIKNELGENITITHIVVKPLESCFDFAGYFDWSAEGEAVFHGEQPTSQTTTGEYAFPVYSGSDAGYTIAKDEAKNPCFYVWGFQRADKEGTPFVVQVRFKNSADKVFTTKPFSIPAPSSKLEAGKKLFDDGFAYHSLLPITKANFDIEGSASDWNGNGGFLPNDGGNGTGGTGAASYGGESVSLGFKTPLDFVAEAPAINKLGDGFVTNHDLPTQNVYEYMENYEVGYFSYYQAKALFTKKDWLKDSKYYLPTNSQWQSILPNSSNYIRFNTTHSKSTRTEMAQVGETSAQSYNNSEYITLKEGKQYVTYAVRFKTSDWVSAWRYSFEGEDSKKKMVIKCVPLKGRPNALLDVTKIANPEFFTTNACSIRTFPTYGVRASNTSATVSHIGSYGYYWSVTPSPSNYAYYFFFSSGDAYVSHYNSTYGLPVRPFVRP